MKYCDEHVYVGVCVSACLCVCLFVRQHISGAARAIVTIFLCMLPMAVARFSFGRMTKSQGKGVYIPIHNAL